MHELIQRDYKYRGRVLDLSVSRFASSRSGEVDIEVVHHNGGAGTLAVYDDGTVALVRQWRYVLGRYTLEISAGRIERGHAPLETAERELEEEMGLRAKEMVKLAEFQVAPGYSEERIWVYLARGLESCSQNLDDDEEIDVVRMPFADALAKVQSGEIDDAKTIITLLTAAPLLTGSLTGSLIGSNPGDLPRP
jgi:ADP-ribose pyrophosphatase